MKANGARKPGINAAVGDVPEANHQAVIIRQAVLPGSYYGVQDQEEP